MSPANWRDLLFAAPSSTGSPRTDPDPPRFQIPEGYTPADSVKLATTQQWIRTGSLLRLNEYIVLFTSVEKWGSDKRTFQALRDCFSIVRDPGTIPRRTANRLQKDHFQGRSTVPPALSGFLSAAGQ